MNKQIYPARRNRKRHACGVEVVDKRPSLRGTKQSLHRTIIVQVD